MRIFIFLEHKSSYDKNLYEEILEYLLLFRKLMIQEIGYFQPIIPVLLYHGKELFKWKSSLQEEDFKSFFSKIPKELRKNMLNYKLKIINIKDPEIRKGAKKLDEILYNSFTSDRSLLGEELLKDLRRQPRKIAELRILEYLKDNTALNLKIWKEAEKLLVKEDILEETGFWEGMQKGRQEGMQEIVLNLLKEKTEIAFISKITSFSKEEIEKLKNSS
ncbi:MAG: Rpn family recombination-promoting nuclease/putative transposase [Bdellovibrionales bacterium]|nr:Rpn family recombination-promoting nuclease/putative transposase [Bdellovibrionales bacterium]